MVYPVGWDDQTNIFYLSFSTLITSNSSEYKEVI